MDGGQAVQRGADGKGGAAVTWLSDAQSVEDGAPREGLEIKHGVEVHRISTGSRDIIIGGNTYFAATAERGAIETTMLSKETEFSFHLPSSHPFAQRWLSGNAPSIATVSVWQKQLVSGQAERLWTGRIQSCSAQGHVVTFRGDTQATTALKRLLPTISVGRLCPHILYDANCKVARNGMRIVTTVASFDGRVITVASIGAFTDHFAQYGELVHIPSGERFLISDQVGAVVTLQRAIFGVQDGDAVHVFAGCDHRITTCHSKFVNRANFGGFPHLPTKNVFARSGYGIYTSEPDE